MTRNRRSGSRRLRGSRRGRLARCGVDIGADNPPARAAALDSAEVDILCLGQPPRERRCLDPVSLGARAAQPERLAQAASRPARARAAPSESASALGSGAALGGAGAAVSAFSAAAEASSPSPAMIAIGAPTFTPSVPSGTRILAIFPSSTASNSIVALSVSISARMSPDFTSSPSFTSHLASVPSSMVGDKAGILSSIGMRICPNKARAAQSQCGGSGQVRAETLVGGLHFPKD